MLTMTKEYTANKKASIKNIDHRINTLHESQRRNPKIDYEQKKTALFEKKQEELIKLSAPSQSLSHHRTLSGEQNSANFWRRVFPITRGRKGILSINKVDDWTNPPPKNTILPTQTQETAKESSKYYEYLLSSRRNKSNQNR
eukprot:6210962-Pleurochrysis_carterae.AAC.1